MRPPDLPGGNTPGCSAATRSSSGFNEAAGFTRRKREHRTPRPEARRPASMRPPDLPGGNKNDYDRFLVNPYRFNEAAGFTRRKPPFDSGTNRTPA